MITPAKGGIMMVIHQLRLIPRSVSAGHQLGSPKWFEVGFFELSLNTGCVQGLLIELSSIRG
jgi:hypothetical protein